MKKKAIKNERKEPPMYQCQWCLRLFYTALAVERHYRTCSSLKDRIKQREMDDYGGSDQ